jgi:excisionase family DNA binding protein
MTVYRLIKTGKLPAVRIGKAYRVREDDLESYLDASYVTAV